MFRKIIICFSLIALLLAFGLVVVTEVVLSPERLKNLVQPYLSAQLGRQVTVDRIELSLFSGLNVQSLTVMDDPAFSRERFAVAKGVRIEFTPLSLLTWSVDRIALDRPVVNLIRDQKDRFNFFDLLKPLIALAGKFKLNIPAATIEGGRIDILDRQSNKRIVLDNIRLQSRDMSLQEPFPFSLTLKANGSELTIIGRKPALDLEGQVKLHLKSFGLRPLGAFLPPGFIPAPQQGTVSAQLTLKGFSFREMRATGRVVAEHLGLMTGKGLKSGLAAQADLDLSYDLKNLKTDIRTLDFKLGSNRLVVSGHWNPRDTDLDLKLPTQPWGDLIGFFSRPGLNPPLGKISAELKARSRKNRPEVELAGGFKIFGLTKPGAKNRPLDHQGEIKALYVPESSSFSLDHLTIKGPALEARARGSFSQRGLVLKAPLLKSDLGLLARMVPLPKGLGIRGVVRGGLELSGSPDKMERIKASAQLNLDQISLKSPDLPGPLSLSGQVRIKDQALSGLDLQGKILDTSFKVNGQGNNILTKPRLRMDIRANRADLAKLLGPSVKNALGLGQSREGKLKVPPGLTVQGRIRVKKLKISIVPLNNFGTDYLLHNSVLTFVPLDPEKWRGTTLNSEVRLSLGD